MEPSELLARARKRAANPSDPLETLAAANELSQELTRDADALIDLAVRDARAAGTSWTAIGDRLGVSKQAARKRFTRNFTHPFSARKVRRAAACSFCRKPPNPHLHMVYGEGGRICAECVALAAEIVADKAKTK
ncbi:ClpX C4-type zinc finger protein [Herbidospora cretacea]|uniref:ClpX C4-type zinc finger protein n=1 Tax=Herbidospora cretacea TaxID=28444 RepID=UPI00077396A1|nr:ClpX C4-type zinc finger protein [Herbidospora cretacea]